mmetsp:Transcript_6990/g.19742  ORF Transcript_6990/g.19742 Transcript_6990/m.19742 type:complete len:263 (+) Transcript_6990:310-1098(+)
MPPVINHVSQLGVEAPWKGAKLLLCPGEDAVPVQGLLAPEDSPEGVQAKPPYVAGRNPNWPTTGLPYDPLVTGSRLQGFVHDLQGRADAVHEGVHVGQRAVDSLHQQPHVLCPLLHRQLLDVQVELYGTNQHRLVDVDPDGGGAVDFGVQQQGVALWAEELAQLGLEARARSAGERDGHGRPHVATGQPVVVCLELQRVPVDEEPTPRDEAPAAGLYDFVARKLVAADLHVEVERGLGLVHSHVVLREAGVQAAHQLLGDGP